MITPLPTLPVPSEKLASATLDKLLLRKSWWTVDTKKIVILKLFGLSLELVKVNRKLFSLKPSQIMLSGLDSSIEIVVRREYGNNSE
jgi:hypothetical protein